MLLVPRQLRRYGMTGDVPYYGGRLTPARINPITHPSRPPVGPPVVGFDRPSFSGEVLEELRRLEDAGVVRLVDLLVVVRADDGTLQTSSPPEGSTRPLEET